MNKIIEVNKVKFMDIISYPKINIYESKVTFINGESGCGKSSLLKLINGVYPLSEGTIKYLNKDINEYNKLELRKDILLCSQTVYLFDKSFRDNFNDFYDYRGIDHLDDKQMRYYLDICIIDISLDESCINLSGGQRQRVFMAICLSFKPCVLMLDEPTSALDDKNAYLLMKSLIAYSKDNEMTLVIVSHNNELSQEFSDYIITLRSDNHE